MSVVKWVAGGWVLFTLENVVLSENRTRLIELLGGTKNYHFVFNLTSSAALLSIAFGYWKYGPGKVRSVSGPAKWMGAVCVACGAGLLSQLGSRDSSGIRGVSRITRHPQLYGIGLVGLGLALRSPFSGRRALFSGPLGVALVGTHHQDSRFRRGIGGQLSPEKDLKSPNLPFAAFLSGTHEWSDLKELELKPLLVGVLGSQAALLTMSKLVRRKS